MDIDQGITNAWNSTVEDYHRAHNEYWAGLWTEDTLRLNFIRRLSENIKINRILAETEYPVEQEVYQPDILVDVESDKGINETIVFELKFFSASFPKCKRDLEKLRKYRLMGWSRGYFLAFEYSGVCEKIRVELAKIEKEMIFITPDYRIIGLVSCEECGGICNTNFFRYLMKTLFGTGRASIAINERDACAFATLKDYGFGFYLHDDRLITIAGFKGCSERSPDFIKRAGYQLVEISESGRPEASDMGGYVLIKEIPYTDTIGSDEAAAQLAGPIRDFIKKMGTTKKGRRA